MKTILAAVVAAVVGLGGLAGTARADHWHGHGGYGHGYGYGYHHHHHSHRPYYGAGWGGYGGYYRPAPITGTSIYLGIGNPRPYTQPYNNYYYGGYGGGYYTGSLYYSNPYYYGY